MKLEYETLSFSEEGERVKAVFLRLFCFYLDKEDLDRIGKFSFGKNYIEFENPGAETSFVRLLSAGFARLKNMLSGKPAVYVHKNSGIPLIGSVAFGLVDRNTNVIEVKPITGCNLSCVYCSVDECAREADFVVEAGYLVDEFRKLASMKACNDLEAHIGTQGEPLLYADIIPLVKGLSSVKEVKVISIDTNGTMLTKQLVDSLVEAGLTRFNLSVNSIDKITAEKMAGKAYNISKILEIAEYITAKCDLIIAPLWVPGLNDRELSKIAEFAKKIRKPGHSLIVGIQNFLCYREGKSPAKPAKWDDFYSMLKKLEAETGEKLILSAADFGIHPAKALQKPFRKGNKVKAAILCRGRMPGELIAASGGRNITLTGCRKGSGEVLVKITREKHNIFYGICQS